MKSLFLLTSKYHKIFAILLLCFSLSSCFIPLVGEVAPGPKYHIQWNSTGWTKIHTMNEQGDKLIIYTQDGRPISNNRIAKLETSGATLFRTGFYDTIYRKPNMTLDNCIHLHTQKIILNNGYLVITQGTCKPGVLTENLSYIDDSIATNPSEQLQPTLGYFRHFNSDQDNYGAHYNIEYIGLTSLTDNKTLKKTLIDAKLVRR